MGWGGRNPPQQTKLSQWNRVGHKVINPGYVTKAASTYHHGLASGCSAPKVRHE